MTFHNEATHWDFSTQALVWVIYSRLFASGLLVGQYLIILFIIHSHFISSISTFYFKFFELSRNFSIIILVSCFFHLRVLIFLLFKLAQKLPIIPAKILT